MLDLKFIREQVRSESITRNSPSLIIRPKELVTDGDTSYYFSGVKANEHIRHNGDIVILGEVGPNAIVESASGGVTVLQIEKGHLVTGSIEPNTLIRAKKDIILRGAGSNSEIISTCGEIHARKQFFGPSPVYSLTAEFTVTRQSGFAENVRAFAKGDIHTTRENAFMTPERSPKTDDELKGLRICHSETGRIIIVGDQELPGTEEKKVKLPVRAQVSP